MRKIYKFALLVIIVFRFIKPLAFFKLLTNRPCDNCDTSVCVHCFVHSDGILENAKENGF